MSSPRVNIRNKTRKLNPSCIRNVHANFIWYMFHFQLDGKNCCPQSKRNSIQYDTSKSLWRKPKWKWNMYLHYLYDYKKEYCIEHHVRGSSKINHKITYTFHYELTNPNNRRAKENNFTYKLNPPVPRDWFQTIFHRRNPSRANLIHEGRI